MKELITLNTYHTTLHFHPRRARTITQKRIFLAPKLRNQRDTGKVREEGNSTQRTNFDDKKWGISPVSNINAVRKAETERECLGRREDFGEETRETAARLV